MPRILHLEHFKEVPRSDASTTKQPSLKGNKGALIGNRFGDEENKSAIVILTSKSGQKVEGTAVRCASSLLQRQFPLYCMSNV